MSRSTRKPYDYYINCDSLKEDKQINNRMTRRKNKQINFEDEEYEVKTKKSVRDRYNWADDASKHYVQDKELQIKASRK